jgi:hypothetical protein
MLLIVPCLHHESDVNALLAFRALKGPWRKLFFGSFHPMKDRKRGSLIFSCFLYITEVGYYLVHLGLEENMQSETFL